MWYGHMDQFWWVKIPSECSGFPSGEHRDNLEEHMWQWAMVNAADEGVIVLPYLNNL